MSNPTDEKLITINNQTVKLPRHVAIIIDGNGRWAKERGLTRMQGHGAVFAMLYAIIMNRRIVGKVAKKIIRKR